MQARDAFFAAAGRFVERPEAGSYRLGMRLLELGNLVKARLDVREAAIEKWGSGWMLESLNDYRATFGDTAVSPIIEEEDESNLANASTEPDPTGDEDAEMVGPEDGGNAAARVPRWWWGGK